jgi:hypothetical protein
MVDFDLSRSYLIVQRCVEAHERRSVATQTKATRGNTSERAKARRGSTGGHRVTPARPERILRMRKSSKSQADDTLTWRARMSATKNGMEDRLTERWVRYRRGKTSESQNPRASPA